jgi:hypothetical protein
MSITLVSHLWSQRLIRPIKSVIYNDRSDIEEEGFAYCEFKLKLETSFIFPDGHDPLFAEHYEFAMIIERLIQDDWNWDKEIERLKDIRIYKTNDNVLKVLSLVEDIKEKVDAKQG